MRWHNDRGDKVGTFGPEHLAEPTYLEGRHDIRGDRVNGLKRIAHTYGDNVGLDRSSGDVQLARAGGRRGRDSEGISSPSGELESGRQRRQTHEVSERDSAVVLQLLQEALSRLRGRRPSSASSGTKKALHDTIVACNSLAMSALGRGNTLRCKELLTQALEVAGDKRAHHGSSPDQDDISRGRAETNATIANAALQVLTLNNTACLHRRLGEPRRALKFLRRAAKIGRESRGSEHLEATHINACAVLSELGRHEEALEHARSAVFYGQEREELARRPSHCDVGPEGPGFVPGGGNDGGEGNRRARLATLAVAYYNLAVELEYTRRYDACLCWYNEAVKLARDPDVRNEELIKRFQRSFAAARKKHQSRIDRRPVVGKRRKGSDDPLARSDGRLPSSGLNLSALPFRGHQYRSPPCNDEHNAQQWRSSGRRMHTNSSSPGTAEKRGIVRVDWPHLGRVERQRAGDERRSKTEAERHRHANLVENLVASEERTGEQRRRKGRTRSFADVRVAREQSDTVASFCPGDQPGGEGCDGDTWVRDRQKHRRREPRERPASAEVPRRHHQLKRPHSGSDPHLLHPEIGDSINVEPSWQLHCDDAGEKRCGPSEREQHNGAEDARRLPVAHFRRPKSACPILEDRSRPIGGAGSGGEVSDVGDESGDTRRRVKVDRARSRSALSSRDERPSLVSAKDGGEPRNRRRSEGYSRGDNTETCLMGAAQKYVEDRNSNSHSVNRGRAKRARIAVIEDSTLERGCEEAKRIPITREHHRSAAAEMPWKGPRYRRRQSIIGMRVSSSSAKSNRTSRGSQTTLVKSRDVHGSGSRRDLHHRSGSPASDRGTQGSRDDEARHTVNGRDGKMYIETQPQKGEQRDWSWSLLEGPTIASHREKKLRTPGLILAYPEAAAHAQNEGSTRVEASTTTQVDTASACKVEREPTAERETTSSVAINNAQHESLQLRVTPASGRAARVDVVDKVAGGDDEPELQARTDQASSRAHVGDSSQQDSAAVAIQRECRRFVERRALDRRRGLAGSAIRRWIVRVCTTRRRQRERVKDMRQRWEREIQRIGANRIQAFVRQSLARREFQRRVWAANGLQRLVRGRRGRIEIEELRRSRLQERIATCQRIQRLFRGHQGRRRARRRHQILWEVRYGAQETIARNGAAEVIQSARRFQVQQRNQRKNAPTVDSCVLATLKSTTPEATVRRGSQQSMRETIPVASELRSPPSGSGNTSETAADSSFLARDEMKEGLWRDEAAASMYTLWGAFVSLLTAAATRCAVRREIAAALLSFPVGSALSALNRGCTLQGDRHGHRRLTTIMKTEFDVSFSNDKQDSDESGRDGLERGVKAARRRLAGAARVRAVSYSTIRAVAVLIVGNVDGQASTERAGAALEDNGVVEAAWREIEAVTLETVQECGATLSTSADCTAESDGSRNHERLRAVLLETLQNFVEDLGRIRELLRHAAARGTSVTAVDDNYSSAQARLHHIAQIPMPLLEVLSASAVLSLVTHPDFADTVAITAAADYHCEYGCDDGRSEGYDRCVAETYGLVLVPPSPFGDCPGEYFPTTSAEDDGNDVRRTQSLELVDDDISRGHIPTRGSSFRQRAATCLQAQERSKVMLAMLARTDDAAEDILRILEASCAPLSSDENGRKRGGGRGLVDQVLLTKEYSTVVQSLAEDVYGLAARASLHNSDGGEEEALLVDGAARVMQRSARRLMARRRWIMISQNRVTAAAAIQRCARRRIRRRQIRRQKGQTCSIRTNLASDVAVRATEEALIRLLTDPAEISRKRERAIASPPASIDHTDAAAAPFNVKLSIIRRDEGSSEVQEEHPGRPRSGSTRRDRCRKKSVTFYPDDVYIESTYGVVTFASSVEESKNQPMEQRRPHKAFGISCQR